jgi:hypothetical protein
MIKFLLWVIFVYEVNIEDSLQFARYSHNFFKEISVPYSLQPRVKRYCYYVLLVPNTKDYEACYCFDYQLENLPFEL